MLAHDPQRSGGSSNELRPPFARKWHRLFPDDGIQSGVEPIISGGKLFIGTLAGSLHALDTETGKDLWTFGTGGRFCTPQQVTAQISVYAGTEDMRVHALALRNGRQIWTSEPLPGASMGGYHPVIAPDGSVLQSIQSVIN